MTEILARLTLTRKDSTRIIVEVHSDATFHNFFRFYKQQGTRWSTKKLTRTASRNEYLDHGCAHRQIAGLELIAVRMAVLPHFDNPIIATRIRLLRKRAYQHLIHANPDELQLSKVEPILNANPAYLQPTAGPIQIKLISKLNHRSIHAGAR